MAIFISISVAVISIFYYMSVTINPIQDERVKKAPPYQFFSRNFYKCEN